MQGVFYRKSASEQARALGITGTVQNEPDGSVLIYASGSEQQLQTFAAWCRQGPARAEVQEVFIEELTGQPLAAEAGFRILRD